MSWGKRGIHKDSLTIKDNDLNRKKVKRRKTTAKNSLSVRVASCSIDFFIPVHLNLYESATMKFFLADSIE